MSPEKRRAIAQMLADTRFEILPLGGAGEAAAALPEGTTITITSSPAKGIEATIELAERLAPLGLDVVPHLSAKQVPGDRLGEFVERLDAVGVRDVFVVGGDATDAVGDFANGSELLEALAQLEHPFTRLGVPAYPEGHHAIDDATLTDALLHKQRYASYLVTQLCFDADRIAGWLRAVRADGVTMRAYAGIPGIVDRRRLVTISLKIGIGDSARFLRGNRATALRLVRGGYRPDSLVKRLGALARDGEAEIDGFHVYTFNQLAASHEWAVQTLRRAEAARQQARRLRGAAPRHRRGGTGVAAPTPSATEPARTEPPDTAATAGTSRTAGGT